MNENWRENNIINQKLLKILGVETKEDMYAGLSDVYIHIQSNELPTVTMSYENAKEIDGRKFKKIISEINSLDTRANEKFLRKAAKAIQLKLQEYCKLNKESGGTFSVPFYFIDGSDPFYQILKKELEEVNSDG